MSLLSAADYPAIRALVDASLTKAQLPDATIALDDFIGAGQDAVLQRDPLAETRGGVQLQRAQRAARLFTAALLAATALQRVARDYTEGPGSESVRYQTGVSPAKRAAELRDQAILQLDSYLTEAEEDAAGVEPPDLFAVASPKRKCRPFIGLLPPNWDGW